MDLLEKLAAERPVFLAFLVFLTSAGIIIPLSFPFYFLYPTEFLVNLLSEAHGMVFDLLIIGFFLFWLNQLAERRTKNNRYREEIEDFLGWKSPEATHRIAGNIRRLNRGGVKQDIRLTEAFLEGANLAGASLVNSDLWGAELRGANLAGADLRNTNLAGACLEGADMERVRIEGSDLRGANFIEADLERADLSRSDLRGAILRGVDLQYAEIDDANLERTNLEGANLRGVIMLRSNLQRAVLVGANLRTANLNQSNLCGADLTDTDLGGASFFGARLPEGEDLLNLFRPARNLMGARLDPEVQEILENALPHLFSTRYYPGWRKVSAGKGEATSESGDGALMTPVPPEAMPE